mgnify:FL=1|jgi:hypothetical protein|tara:strand:+ start:280 stop:528 length:249 start_codon:yes stop_codon:yes gene_type:complete
MSEQQGHLANLLQQRQTLIDEINGLQQQAAEKRELLLRASGAIEYLQQVGVTLPEESAEPEAPEVEAETTEPEVVTEPTPVA